MRDHLNDLRYQNAFEDGVRHVLLMFGINPAHRPTERLGGPSGEFAKQAEVVLAILKAGASNLTQKHATSIGIMRLAARIEELRDAGWQIADTWVYLPNGKRVKRYYMPNPKAPIGEPREQQTNFETN